PDSAAFWNGRFDEKIALPPMNDMNLPSGEKSGAPRKPGVSVPVIDRESRASTRRMETGPGNDVNARYVPSGESAMSGLNPGPITLPAGKPTTNRAIRRSAVSVELAFSERHVTPTTASSATPAVNAIHGLARAVMRLRNGRHQPAVLRAGTGTHAPESSIRSRSSIWLRRSAADCVR